LTIRPAALADLAALVAIYNHYVEHTHVTFDTEPFSGAERQTWLEQFDGGRYRCLVIEAQGRVAGYASSVRFKPKPAYQTSVEVSVYLHPDVTGRGYGKALYAALLPQLASANLHRAYAGIALPNDASIALHRGFGFHEAAHFTEVGFKFDRYWDVVWLERPLG
jgi:phosphinothricin acetyltransferase